MTNNQDSTLNREIPVQFMSESGRPLLYSFDENAYDDAAYLVDRTFDRPYQFTGNVHPRARSRNSMVHNNGRDMLPP